jgi:hypothetical protein
LCGTAADNSGPRRLDAVLVAVIVSLGSIKRRSLQAIRREKAAGSRAGQEAIRDGAACRAHVGYR